jgi:hypothetical protein
VSRRFGPREFDAEYVAKISNKIDMIDLGLDLIVFGFDEDNGAGHISRVVNPGESFSDDIVGYSAIGSGLAMAYASLNSRPLDQSSAEALVYRLCEVSSTRRRHLASAGGRRYRS